MSEFLAAAAAAVGGPPDLVERSATARATAQGTSVDEVLKAWAGGEHLAAGEPSPAPPVEKSPEPAPVTEAAPAAPAVAAAAPAVASEPEPVAAMPVAAVVLEEPPPDPIEPASLRDRIVLPGKLGAMIGAMFGVMAAVGASAFLFDRATLAGTEDAVHTVLDVNPFRFLVSAGAVSAVFGAVVARLSAIVPAWFDRGLSVRTSRLVNTTLGGVLGLVLGVVGGGVLLGLGTPLEPLGGDAETITQLSVVSTMVTVLLGGAVLGAVTAVAVQLLALPAGLTESEQEESEVIKHRLVTSYLMPLLVVLGIAALVLPFAYLLVTFHTWAPLLAMVAAGGILGFAGLSASRPGMKITAGEFVVAAAGIGALLLIVALIANATTSGEGHEEGLRILLG